MIKNPVWVLSLVGRFRRRVERNVENLLIDKVQDQTLPLLQIISISPLPDAQSFEFYVDRW